MELRLAAERDLPTLKEMYRRVVEDMCQNGLDIWDDIYPTEFLKDDIAERSLYLAQEGNQIAAAFVLKNTAGGADSIRWSLPGSAVIYIDRLAVSVDFARQGLGGRMLCFAAALAEEKGCSVLRLFVVDSNIPALHLYRKSGFRQAEGCYIETFDDGFSLRQYGFEIEIQKLLE